MKTVELNNAKAVSMIREVCIDAYHTTPRITAKIIGGKMVYILTVNK